MATFLLQAAGQAVGSAIGGPFGGIVGRIVGGVAGAYIDSALLGQPGRPVEGLRLSDLNGIASTEGAPIPRVYGRARLGGQVIWATAFEEVVSTSRVRSGGGKGGMGGGGATQTSYSYFANVAVALCEGPVAYVRRVWADGEPFDLSKAAMRVHLGTEDQAPDPLIVAKDGEALATAYRGTAYVVFERLPLADYGNRLPQLTFEVVSPVPGLADDIRAVNIIPGSGEFVYDTLAVSRNFTYGNTQSENRHQYSHPTDWAASFDQLQALCPNLGSVSLVVSWFGDDLRAGHCTVAPRVDLSDKITTGANWSVAGLSRAMVRVSSKVDGRAAYGGTPSDASVIRAIRDLKARGLAVTLYPFMMMDVVAGNALPDPWSGAPGQPAYPWRGRLTCHPAPGVSGSPDGTAAAAAQVATLFGTAAAANFAIAGSSVLYSGPAEWSLRRQVLHYAYLAKAAGGVDAFLIGSEMVGLTRVQSAPGVYPAVTALEQLAQDVRAVLGPDTKISYAADWTEYGAHVTGGEVRFPLDPLWASSAIDFVGIDWYPPLSDWRDGRAHADAAIATGPLALDYLTGRVTSGEAFDWYYADEAARAAQDRRPITDGLGKPWTFRQKDLAGWWLNAHHERVGGIEALEPTAWQPGSKPIRLTEIGCPAVDRGANAPNVFPDFKAGAAGLPYFSRGSRDDLAQNRTLAALLRYFDQRLPGHPVGANPVSPVSGRPMVDADHLAIWAWDARPYPAFPHLMEIWSDGENWSTGHWLNGRLEGVPLGALVRQLAHDLGGLAVDASLLDGFVEGYVVDRTMAARNAIEPLATLFGFDGVERAGAMTFVRRDGTVTTKLGEGDLVPDRDGQLLNLTRAQESELPHEISFTVVDAENDYRSIAVVSRRLEGASRSTSRNDVAVATRRAVVQRLSDIALQEIWIGRETLVARLRPGLIGVEVGDTLAFTVGGEGRLFRLTRITDGVAREIEARAIEPTVHDTTIGPSPLHSISSPPVPGPPHALVIDVPFAERDAAVLQYLAVAASPWPGGFTLWRSAGGESFAARDMVAFPALVGETQSELRPGPLWRFDRGNSLDVTLSGNGLSSIDPLRVLAGENLIAVAGPDGAWELIGFAGAELIGERHWRLTTLLRGLGASEALAARTLPAGAPVVVIDQTLVPLTGQIDDLFRDYQYRLTPAGADLGDPAAIGFVASASPLVLLPYAPVAARARRQDDGIALSWIRRTRRGGDSWDIAEVPLSEEREAYEVDILSGGVALRTLSTAGPSLLYTEELADFGAAQMTLSLRICQLSAVAGRGLPLRADIPVR